MGHVHILVVLSEVGVVLLALAAISFSTGQLLWINGPSFGDLLPLGHDPKVSWGDLRQQTGTPLESRNGKYNYFCVFLRMESDSFPLVLMVGLSNRK